HRPPCQICSSRGPPDYSQEGWTGHDALRVPTVPKFVTVKPLLPTLVYLRSLSPAVLRKPSGPPTATAETKDRIAAMRGRRNRPGTLTMNLHARLENIEEGEDCRPI